ncbi:MAG: hypothetical protein IT423_04770, partial [Pirellulaceae bacterium]|nr:hypothetical protein [Pirellulaceae bacterium]
MNKCCEKLRRFALLGCLCLANAICSATTMAQDTIGVIAEAIKPEIAEKLKLSEDQRAKMMQLLKSRESEMLGLAQQLRESPPDQRQVMRNEFRTETERRGYALLDVEQRSQLERIRVEKLGLLSLAEPGIATVMNLADWQKAKIAELVSRANASARSADAERVRADVQRALRNEISESQWATWQVLAGQSNSADVGNPQPPERKQPNPAVANANAAGPGSTVANSAATSGLSSDKLPVNSVRLKMNFQAMPWAEVLKWMCEQADLSLKADAMPPGSFTYRDNSHDYSVGEALDIMSASLLGNGYSLVRRDRLLMVVDLEAPMVKNYIKELAEFVPIEQLDARGDFELVKCLFFLSRLNPDDAKKEVEQLLSLQGSVISLPSTGQIQVIDTAGVMRAVRALVQRAEDPESMRGSSIVAMPLKHITANEVLDVARPLLGLPEGANSNLDISLSMDTFGNTLFVNAKKTEDVQKLRDLVMHLDTAPTPVEQGQIGREAAVVQVHEILGSDPELAFRVLSQRLASEPDVRMEMDKETNKLIVQARPTTHKEIDEVLLMLGGQGSNFEVLDLKMDTQVAIAAIEKFFGLSKTGTADPTAPIIDGDLITRRLYVKANPKQLEQIKTLIEKMEASAANNDLGGNVRIIPLPPRKVDRALEQVERLWIATKKRNRIRVVEPGASSGESSFQQRLVVPEEEGRPIFDRAAAEDSDLNGVGKAGSEAASSAAGKGEAPADKANDAQRNDAKSSTKAKPELVPAPADQPKKTSSRLRLPKYVTQQIPGDDARSPSDVATSDQGLDNAEADGDIVVMPGPGGLIITSSDTEALAEFDKMLRMMMDSSSLGSAEPTFF